MNKTYVLSIDIKRSVNFRTPHFIQREDGTLIFQVFDDGKELDISSATKAEITHRTPSGEVILGKCEFITYEGKRAIRYEIDEIALIETGISHLTLYINKDGNMIASQPFPICVYENLKDAVTSYLELIQDMMKIIENLKLDLNETIKLSEKGVPNGVATLDSNGRIPLLQMPKEFQAYLDHIPQTVYEHMVHDMRITEDGIMQYKTPSGWQNVGFAPDAVGGSGSGNQVLSASITVNDGIATVIYSGVPTVVSQKWDLGNRNLAHFALNGKSFNDNQFNVEQVGLHTLWYKDSNGNTYTVLFDVTSRMLKQPIIRVNVVDGLVTVSVDHSTSIKKWDKGERDVAYFQYNGNIFTGNSFDVTEVGKYTIYFKTTNGLEYTNIYEITEFMLPPIDISHDVNSKLITFNINPKLNVSLAKWEIGIKDIEYFSNNGTIFNDSFEVDESGDYSAYFKFENGREKIYYLNIELVNLIHDLPLVVKSYNTNSTHGSNYRSYWIGIKTDSEAIIAKFSGDFKGSSTSILNVDGEYKYISNAGYIEFPSTNKAMTVEFLDSNNQLVAKAVHKTESLYNYFVINDEYISLTHIKVDSENYEIPSTIEGLPVLDIGCVLFNNNTSFDNYDIKHLIIPNSITSGGRFAYASDLLSVTIHNPNFKLNHEWALQYNVGGFTVYTPNNSPIYYKLLQLGKNVQPLN